jgi:hypothetical protein
MLLNYLKVIQFIFKILTWTVQRNHDYLYMFSVLTWYKNSSIFGYYQNCRFVFEYSWMLFQKYISNLFIFFFCRTSVWMQGLVLAMQALCHLNQTSSLFCSGSFGDGISWNYLPRLSWNHNKLSIYLNNQ